MKQVKKSRKHSIAFIGGRGLFSSYGGVENATREITKQLSKRDDLNVVVYGVEGELDESFIRRSNLKTVGIQRKIYQLFGQHGFIFACVFHAMFVLRPAAVILFASGPCIFAPLLRLAGIKVITSIRSMDSDRDKWGVISRTILKAGEYCAWKFANHFTANSKKIVESFRAKREDAQFIPNGCNALESRVSDSLEKYGVTHNNYLLFAARFDPVKRLHLLLEALSELPSEEKLPLIVAGGNSQCAEYEDKLKAYQSDNVIFVGHLSSSELAPLMANCRAFVLPSVLEGMSNSLLAAMANKKAIIAADIAENRDVVELDSALFKQDDLVMLQESIIRVSTDEAFCHELGEQLGSIAKEKYSWESTANKFYKLTL